LVPNVMCKPIKFDDKPFRSQIQGYALKSQSTKSSFVKILASAGVLYVTISKIIIDRTSLSTSIRDPDSVYVPGAGFSGFWFTLGRLQSIERPFEKNYYCFSAGCLGVVSRLTNSSLNDIMDYAVSAQKSWKKGEISRYEVASNFIDKLIPIEDVNSSELVKKSILDRINIVTTTYGVGMNIRRPKNIEELREMLIQTTWIPFATGFGMAKIDPSGKWHVDGGFSFPFHPRCKHNLNLPFKFNLIVNILNPSLTIQKALEFWKDGMSYDF